MTELDIGSKADGVALFIENGSKMIEKRIMNEEEKKDLEGDIKALKVAIYLGSIISPIFIISLLWIQNVSDIEFFGVNVCMAIIIILILIGGRWEAGRIRKDIDNGVVEVISGVVTKDTKPYKSRNYAAEIDHVVVDLKRPVYIGWLKNGNTVEIVRAPISTNICKVEVNGEVVYP